MSNCVVCGGAIKPHRYSKTKCKKCHWLAINRRRAEKQKAYHAAYEAARKGTRVECPPITTWTHDSAGTLALNIVFGEAKATPLKRWINNLATI